jgi:hypothetical protein
VDGGRWAVARTDETGNRRAGDSVKEDRLQ